MPANSGGDWVEAAQTGLRTLPSAAKKSITSAVGWAACSIALASALAPFSFRTPMPILG